jgi:hypothetical protein
MDRPRGNDCEPDAAKTQLFIDFVAARLKAERLRARFAASTDQRICRRLSPTRVSGVPLREPIAATRRR